MSYIAFPTLSKTLSLRTFSEGILTDPVIRTRNENGIIQTRSKFTNTCKKWDFQIDFLKTSSDYDTIQTFLSDISNGTSAFTWESPVNNETYLVRLREPISFSFEETNGDDNFFTVSIKIAETVPNSHLIV